MVDDEEMGSSGNTMKLEALPKGFRFRPTDEELVNHYLRLKINGRHSAVDVIPEIDVCKWEPWDLPAFSLVKSSDHEWFFFCSRDRKYPNGNRSNRATEAGYWKATGKDRTIKSCKLSSSGFSTFLIIGMKKTLVFYKGRAPKGERTNWIMHEYRATEPDFDGTGPGQEDYVLFRLFHKADEKLEHLKTDEVEHSGLFISTTKSSPDDKSSHLFQEPVMLDVQMQILKEPEDVKKWWIDEADYATSTNTAPVESCASDGVDHSGEETAMEVYEPLREVSMSEGATVQSYGYTDLGACVDSPFSDNFGNEQNGLHFQDGTSEQDASLSELLEGLQNHNGNYFYEDSRFSPACIDGSKQTPSATYNVNDCKLHQETYREMVQAQGQISPSLFQPAQSTKHYSHSKSAVKEADSSINKARGSCCKSVGAFYCSNPIKDDNTPVSETGIKIRSRQPRDRPSFAKSTTIQGTAPRRVRLWMGSGSGPKSVCCQKTKGEEHESQSLITQATEDIDRTSKSQESEGRFLKENKETASVKPGQNRSTKVVSFTLSSYMRTYAVSALVVIILSLVFLGMCLCPPLRALGFQF